VHKSTTPRSLSVVARSADERPRIAPAPKWPQRSAQLAPIAHALRPLPVLAVRDDAQSLGLDALRSDLSLLATLVYELLAAHVDTTLLVGEREDNLDWRLHLDYLRALQRLSREILARVDLSETA